jgi:hypothetical protein
LKEIRGKSMVRIVPGGQGDTVTKVGSSVSRSEKKGQESSPRHTIRVQIKLIEMIRDGAKGDFDDEGLEGRGKLSRSITLAKARDRKETTVKGDRREERFHVENRTRSRDDSRRGRRRNRRHRSAQRKRKKRA